MSIYLLVILIWHRASVDICWISFTSELLWDVLSSLLAFIVFSFFWSYILKTSSSQCRAPNGDFKRDLKWANQHLCVIGVGRAAFGICWKCLGIMWGSIVAFTEKRLECKVSYFHTFHLVSVWLLYVISLWNLGQCCCLIVFLILSIDFYISCQSFSVMLLLSVGIYDV